MRGLGCFWKRSFASASRRRDRLGRTFSQRMRPGAVNRDPKKSTFTSDDSALNRVRLPRVSRRVPTEARNSDSRAMCPAACFKPGVSVTEVSPSRLVRGSLLWTLLYCPPGRQFAIEAPGKLDFQPGLGLVNDPREAGASIRDRISVGHGDEAKQPMRHRERVGER
jgi:hypothetical protein